MQDISQASPKIKFLIVVDVVGAVTRRHDHFARSLRRCISSTLSLLVLVRPLRPHTTLVLIGLVSSVTIFDTTPSVNLYSDYLNLPVHSTIGLRCGASFVRLARGVKKVIVLSEYIDDLLAHESTSSMS